MKKSIREIEKYDKCQILNDKQFENEIWHSKKGGIAKLRKRGKKYDSSFHNDKKMLKLQNSD